MYQYGYYPPQTRDYDSGFSPLAAGLLGVGLGYLGGELLDQQHPTGFGPGYGHGYGHGHGPGYGFGPQYGHGQGFNPGPSAGYEGYGQGPGYGPNYGGYGGPGAGYSNMPPGGYGHQNIGYGHNYQDFDGWDSFGANPGYPTRPY